VEAEAPSVPSETKQPASSQLAQSDVGSESPSPANTSAAVAAAPVDLVLNYGKKKEHHVIRLAVSGEALRRGVFDEILEKEGLSFRVAGDRPRDEADAAQPPPELDIVLVGAVPAQIEGVFGALRKRPEDFRPVAVYTAPSDPFLLDWIPIIIDSFSRTPSKEPPPAARNGERPSRPTQMFAWRAPPATPAAIDDLFPPPSKEEQAAAGAQRLGPADVNPDQNYLVIFLLYRDN
jgi:hypothetical protein